MRHKTTFESDLSRGTEVEEMRGLYGEFTSSKIFFIACLLSYNI